MMQQTEHQPVLIVIAGPNGSGKTTITSKILRHEWMENAVYINPDQVAQERFGDWNSPEAVLKAAQFCEEQREDCLRKRQSLIFETVLSSEGKVDFIRRAKEAGFFIRLFFVSTNHPAINSSRIAKRVMQGGHDVPIPKIISRYKKSIVNCKRVASIVNRVYVYDNSVDDIDARLLFRMTDGQLFKRYVDVIPEWAQTICGN
ncbi:MAG: zeta toxin family protein [Prevotella sp.]|nr:zeta toxin family protein [Prevotella sp.]